MPNYKSKIARMIVEKSLCQRLWFYWKSNYHNFIKDDPEIEVLGVGKYSPDEKVNKAISKWFLEFMFLNQKKDDFKKFNISGTIETITR